jgi:hypothetical protein
LKTPIPIAASIAQRPGYGGHAWAFLQYAFGLRQLGYEPIFIDRLTADMVTGSEGQSAGAAKRTAINWFKDVMQFGGLDDSCSLMLDDDQTIGLSREELTSAITNAPCLINVMGFLVDPDLLEAADTLVFLDVDPGFPQLWRELGQADLLSGHHRFVSVGANLGLSRCQVPDCGVDWIATRPPVALDHWPGSSCSSRTFRSVGSWRGPYDPINHDGRTLALRVHEFRKFAELPRRVEAKFEIALDIDKADHRDIALMQSNDWQLLNPFAVAGSLAGYRDFVQSSGAEIAIAKNIYVDTNSGWFSDRSACFLASGRPVLAQDTGFAEALPTGEGLLSFKSIDEAADGADRILRDWPAHSKASRALAEEFFDARKVLGELLAKIDTA